MPFNNGILEVIAIVSGLLGTTAGGFFMGMRRNRANTNRIEIDNFKILLSTYQKELDRSHEYNVETRSKLVECRNEMEKIFNERLESFKKDVNFGNDNK